MGQGILEFPKFVIAEFCHCVNSVLFNLKKKGILELRILEFPSKIKLNILAYYFY